MSKKTLNQANLETLGAAQLAALLMEVSAGNADIKRRLRLELSHNLGAAELGNDVRKRLVALRKSKSYVGWRKRKALIKDLETQVSMITAKIAPEEPSAAFELLWQFIEIAPSVYERVDDSRGDVGDVFRAAREHFEDIAPRAVLDPEGLAARVWAAVQNNEYGEWDGLIPLMAPTLGGAGLARLRELVEEYDAQPVQSDQSDHAALQFLRELRGDDGYSENRANSRKARFVKACMQEIAAVAGDTAGYIAQYSDEDLARKDIAAEVATLLLEDARPEAAMTALQNAQGDMRDFGQERWDTAYIATLSALGRERAAQEHRWDCFCMSLNRTHLRDYLKALPDFEDVEQEDIAKALVLEFPDFEMALNFCIKWPDLLSAAQLINARADEINGNNYAFLTPAADLLRARHPLAAVLLWRAMIDDMLEQSRATRYGYGSDHLADCALLDAQITDYAGHLSHEDFVHRLRREHERKSSFWAKLG